jgi:hypothetical protein
MGASLARLGEDEGVRRRPKAADAAADAADASVAVEAEDVAEQRR